MQQLTFIRRGKLEWQDVPRPSTYGLGDYGGNNWGGALSDLMHVSFADHMLVSIYA